MPPVQLSLFQDPSLLLSAKPSQAPSYRERERERDRERERTGEKEIGDIDIFICPSVFCYHPLYLPRQHTAYIWQSQRQYLLKRLQGSTTPADLSRTPPSSAYPGRSHQSRRVSANPWPVRRMTCRKCWTGSRKGIGTHPCSYR